MAWFLDVIVEATKEFFGGIKDLNPCEDQFMAGVRGDPYPQNDQPYDCAQAYFDGQAAQHSVHSGDTTTSHDPGSGQSESSFGTSDSSTF